VFDDLKLVTALTPEELIRFGREEERISYTDLNAYRKDDDKAKTVRFTPARGRMFARMRPGKDAGSQLDSTGIRNHGLLSKAQRTLDIAGWSEGAQRDVEIFRLIDTEGLTPLLAVLNEANLERGARFNADQINEATQAAPAITNAMPDLRKP